MWASTTGASKCLLGIRRSLGIADLRIGVGRKRLLFSMWALPIRLKGVTWWLRASGNYQGGWELRVKKKEGLTLVNMRFSVRNTDT